MKQCVAIYCRLILKKKVKKRPEYLSSLEAKGKETDFLEYIKEWMGLINRGGLFQVNKSVFCFIIDAEMKFLTLSLPAKCQS